MSQYLSILSLSLMAVSALACGSGSPDETIDVTYAPCEPLQLVPASDATADEMASLEDAIAMWQDYGVDITLDERPDARKLPVKFEPAALAFYGLYEDEVGEVLINRRLDDRRERAITIAHELGHAFGLWHVDRGDRVSVMNTHNLDVEPNVGDMEALEATWRGCQLID